MLNRAPRAIDWSNPYTVPYCAPRPANDAASKDKIAPTSVRPNSGLTAIYRRRLLRRIDAMHNSILYWVRAAYRANEPHVAVLAQDANPANELKRVVAALKKRWFTKFDEGATALGKYFAKSASQRTDAQLQKILKDAGFSVEFKLTAAQQDILHATVNENVNLIKNIPAQAFHRLEGAVMRSVQTGNDVGSLYKELQEQFGMDRRRASLIARDQNSKATAAFNRARQLEVGIEEAIWVHSSAGRQPRPSHVKAGQAKTKFEVAKGWWDPAVKKYIWPGSEINCRCVSRPIIPGFI